MAKQSFIGKLFSGGLMKGVSQPFISSIANQYSQLMTPLLRRNYLDQYKNWVFACVQARAEEVGNTQLQLFQGDEIIDSHPVLDLLAHPNPTMTQHDLFESYQAFRDLDGNAFWYLGRENNGKGAVVEIWPLRPDRVQIVPGKTNPLQVDGYLFQQPDGQKVSFNASEIIHFKNFNPLGNHPFPHRGMGIVEAAAWGIDTDNEARNWNYRFFKNSARPDGILTTPGDGALDGDALLRIRAEWESAHGGSDNSNKVAILGGGITWTEIARSQKDMDFVNQRTFSRDEILALFRTPKSIIGITDDVNRANADAAIYVFSLRTVKPLMQKFTDHLNEMLLPDFGDDLEFDFKSPVTEDRKQSLDEYEAGITGGWLTINEVREQEGLPQVDTGNSLYIPINMISVAETKPEPTLAPKAAKKSTKKGILLKSKVKKSTAEEAVEKLLESKKVKSSLPKGEKTYSLKHFSAEQKAAYIEMWKANLRANAAPLEKACTKFFNNQKAEVMANARHLMKRKSAKSLIEKGLLDFLYDEASSIAASVTFVTPFIADYIKQSGGAAATTLGSTFDPNTDVLTAFIAKRAQYFADSINGTTKEALLTSIKDGLDNGENLQGIEGRISDVYDIATGSRTQMIARTEISAASNQGALGAYTQAGVEKIEWAVVDPEDADCLENEGEVIDIGDTFKSGDEAPPVHPNCECTTLPVFGDS